VLLIYIYSLLFTNTTW